MIEWFISETYLSIFCTEQIDELTYHVLFDIQVAFRCSKNTEK